MRDKAQENHQDEAGSSYQEVNTDIAYNRKNDPELDPFEINFRPEYTAGRGPHEAFVNEHGVLIGDHEYQSEQSPLEQWSKNTDPATMSGDDWVHPYKDIGFHSAENREWFEEGIAPQSSSFQHADQDVAYDAFPTREGEHEEPEGLKGQQAAISDEK
ncbi:DUF3905 domain-containing protein [Paenibacillus filicis]|uniref:DUF3905 domain-containing protein n=1 Tax=Paenibacillus filicis TaxID=669464 RepID=A0ABU9DSE2_9BACL